jgi:hypothetical protein
MTRAPVATLITAAALTFLAPGRADAETLWMCTMSDDAIRLVCVAEADPLHGSEPAPAQRFVVNGTSFPLDPRRSYTVDLWSPPTEMEPVERLARATICYRTPDCSVMVMADRWATYSPSPRLAARWPAR